MARAIAPDDYHRLMDLGWRRSGTVFYRPRCSGCSACVPLRIRTDAFQPSRSQRRAWRRNRDLSVTVGRPVANDEKHALYVRFLRERYDGKMGETFEDMQRFLYTSPVDTREVCYRLDGQLVGVGIVDVSSAAISTVYFFFDADCHRRSLGVFSVLCEIDWARRRGIPFYYLGYWIRDVPSMSYKSRYRPHELLGADGAWHAPIVSSQASPAPQRFSTPERP